MTKKGLTLFEVMVVVAIVLVLTSILLPVFSAAKKSAQVASSTLRLRQISTAISLYRDEWGSNSYGFPSDMGLPEYRQFVFNRFGLSEGALMSPCSGRSKPKAAGEFAYDYLYLPSGGEWAAYTLLRGESAYVMADLHCGNQPFVFSPYKRVFVLALNLGGSVNRITRYGDPTKLRWWIEL